MMEKDDLRDGRCEGFLESLSAYLDGELEAAEAEKVEKHIENCPECRELFDRLSSVSEEVKGLGVEIPADLHSQIMRSVDKAKAEDDISARQKKLSFSARVHKIGLWCGAGIAAVLCLAVIGGPLVREGFSLDAAKDASEEMNISADDAYEDRSAVEDEKCADSFSYLEIYDGEMVAESVNYYSSPAALPPTAYESKILSQIQCTGSEEKDEDELVEAEGCAGGAENDMAFSDVCDDVLKFGEDEKQEECFAFELLPKRGELFARIGK